MARSYKSSMFARANQKYFESPSVFIPYQYRKKGFDSWAVRQGYILGRLDSHYKKMNNEFQEAINRHYAKGK